MQIPFISVVIPAHNEEKHIGLCLGALRKNKGNFEIIVVDDGSTDKTKQIAETFDVNKLIGFGKGHSAAFARNRGAEKSKGIYMAFIDADQIVENNFINKLERFLKGSRVDGSDFLVLSYKPKTFIQKAWSAYRKAYPTMGFVHVVKRSVFIKLRFKESVFYHEELDFKKRFCERGFSYSGPIKSKVYHIDPEGVEEFVRQRKWQGRQAGIKYFLPCIFPPLIFLPFSKVLLKSGDIENSLKWLVLDLTGRYLSLYYRLSNFVNS